MKKKECYKIEGHIMLNIGGWEWVQGIFLEELTTTKNIL